jgi:hypothetical protein
MDRSVLWGLTAAKWASIGTACALKSLMSPFMLAVPLKDTQMRFTLLRALMGPPLRMTEPHDS